jgi:Family of unknown function (DUF6703)
MCSRWLIWRRQADGQVPWSATIAAARCGSLPKGKPRVPNSRPARRRARPLPPGQTLFTPDASQGRQAAERQSAQPLLFLHQLPAWVAPILLALLLVVGLAVRGPGGAVAMCGVALVLCWLAAISWPRLAAGGRLGRALVIAAILAVAGWQATR